MAKPIEIATPQPNSQTPKNNGKIHIDANAKKKKATNKKMYFFILNFF